MKPSETALPGFEGIFSEIISKIPHQRKRGRGRPRKYDNPTHRAYLKNRANQGLGAMIMKKSESGGKLTIRQQQNLIRAERAQNILKKSESGGFLIHYFFNRNTLLGELGRIENKDWLIRTAETVAFDGLRGEQARLFIRKIRFGKDGSPRSRWTARRVRGGIILQFYTGLSTALLYPDLVSNAQIISLAKLSLPKISSITVFT